uniref:Tetratricopeptide repeat (TPR) domain containing protein n=1 Tax=Coptotermes formosanus TaxID=36987 RepID=R4V206_COPFO|nr:tetratricopeptide repeat (TPR) domain containing protein [Coptotermes formosanus]
MQVNWQSSDERGNHLYVVKKYLHALPLFTEAIELCPDSSAYCGNHSACYSKRHQYGNALDDAMKSAALDFTYATEYIAIVKCHLALAELCTAHHALSIVNQLTPTSAAIRPEVQKLAVVRRFDEEALEAYQKPDYRKVVFCMDLLLEEAPCTMFTHVKT